MATGPTHARTKRGLITLLRARAGLNGVQITYSPPGDTLENRNITLGETRGTQEITSIKGGRQRRTETYTIDVVVTVATADGSQEDADEDAEVWAGEVESAVAETPNLGLDYVDWATVVSNDLAGGRLAEGRAAQVTLGVEVHTQLF